MDHVDDLDLERYHLGLVATAGGELARVEEHLLWCHACVERAEQAAAYVDAMRAAMV